jgi:hypothetical protein
MKAPDFSTERRSTGTRDLLLLAGGLLCLVASAYAASSAWAELRHARRASEESRQELRQLAPRTQALVQRLERGGGGATAQAALTLDAPPRQVIAELTRLLPQDVKLVELVLAYGGRVQVDALVEARSPLGYDRFLERLSSSASFEEVLPGAEVRQGRLRVSVRMRYRRAGRS